MALSWLKDKFDDVSKTLQSEVNKFKNQAFLDAVVAGCALVAYADGTVSSAEKQKMVGFLRTNEILSAFPIEQTIASFEKVASKFDFDRAIGEMEALAVIGKMKGKTAESRLMVRVCCAIGSSDGSFDAEEKKVVSRICRELDLDPTEFDL